MAAASWTQHDHDRQRHDRLNGQPDLVLAGKEEPDGCGRDQDEKDKVLRGEGDQAVHDAAA